MTASDPDAAAVTIPASSESSSWWVSDSQSLSKTVLLWQSACDYCAPVMHSLSESHSVLV